MEKLSHYGTTLGVTLFALVFALAFTAGGVMGGIYPLYKQAASWWTARDYVPVLATVAKVDLNQKRSKNSETFHTVASFNYVLGGRSYEGGHASFSVGADSVGDYQVRLYDQLQEVRDAGRQVTLWVDPLHPEQAVFDRTPRWQMTMFHLPFAVLFTGIGLAGWTVLFCVWFVEPSKPMAESLAAGKHPRVRANGSGALWMTVFALAWNVIAWPLGLLALEDFLTGQNAWAGLAMIFPAVGVACACLAWRRWRSQWRAGRPVAEVTGLGPLRGRIHLVPALGTRLPGGSSPIPVQLDVALMQEAPKAKNAKTATLWRQRVLHTSLARGSTHLDFEVLTPPEGAQNGLHLLLTIAGVEVDFALPPSNDASNPKKKN